MTLKIVDPGVDTKGSFCIYGANGEGKTHLAATAKGKKLFIDYNGNVETLLKFPKTDWVVVQGPTKWSEMVAMWSDAFLDEFPVVVVDNLTGVNRALVQEGLGLTYSGAAREFREVPDLRVYNVAAERLRSFCASLKERAKLNKNHIIGVAHEQIKEDKLTGQQLGGPSVPGQVPAYVLSLFSEMIYLKRVNGKRTAYVARSGVFPAATRVLSADKEVVDPNLTTMYPMYFK